MLHPNDASQNFANLRPFAPQRSVSAKPQPGSWDIRGDLPGNDARDRSRYLKPHFFDNKATGRRTGRSASAGTLPKQTGFSFFGAWPPWRWENIAEMQD